MAGIVCRTCTRCCLVSPHFNCVVLPSARLQFVFSPVYRYVVVPVEKYVVIEVRPSVGAAHGSNEVLTGPAGASLEGDGGRVDNDTMRSAILDSQNRDQPEDQLGTGGILAEGTVAKEHAIAAVGTAAAVRVMTAMLSTLLHIVVSERGHEEACISGSGTGSDADEAQQCSDSGDADTCAEVAAGSDDELLSASAFDHDMHKLAAMPLAKRTRILSIMGEQAPHCTRALRAYMRNPGATVTREHMIVNVEGAADAMAG